MARALLMFATGHPGAVSALWGVVLLAGLVSLAVAVGTGLLVRAKLRKRGGWRGWMWLTIPIWTLMMLLAACYILGIR